MWCTCKKAARDGFSRIDRRTENPTGSDLWGHGRCGRPTYAYFKKLTAMRCPRGAKAIISVFARSDGMTELTFAMSNGERKTVLQVSKKPTVLERLWIELDVTMDSLMAMSELSDIEKQKAATSIDRLRIKARAQADTLAILMDPWFSTADDIAREAKNRWEARKKHDDTYETPGLSGEEYVPPAPKVYADQDKSSESGTNRTSGTKRTNPASRSQKGKTLSEDVLPTIKQAIESGMFSVADISRSYGVPEEVVKQQVGLE